jgi:hypothetical protein
VAGGWGEKGGLCAGKKEREEWAGWERGNMLAKEEYNKG